MGLFGGSSTKKTYITETTALTQDQRLAIEGGVGTVLAPGAAAGGMGTISAAPESTVYSEITVSGLGAEDVGLMMEAVFEDTQETQRQMAGLAGSVVAASQRSQAALTDVVAAAKVPEIAQAKSMMPLIVVAVVLYFVLWGFK